MNDPVVGLVSKRTVRTWINNDGSENPLKKDLGEIPYSPSGSRSATKRRRENVIDSLEQNVIALLAQGGGGAAAVGLAQSFLVDLSADIDAFYKSGSEQRIVDRLQTGELDESYPFLTQQIQPGVTVVDFIVSQLTY